MSQMQTISTRFTADTLARLEEISKNQNRSRSELIQEAVDGYLNSFLWLEAKVAKSRESIQQGNTISDADIKLKYKR